MYNSNKIKTEDELMNEISKLYDLRQEISYLGTLSDAELCIIEDYSEFIVQKIKAAFYLGAISK